MITKEKNRVVTPGKRPVSLKKKITNFSIEAEQPGILHGNENLINELEIQGKSYLYKKFAKNIPNGLLADEVIEYFSKLNKEECREIVSYLYRYESPWDLIPELYEDRTTGIGKMYDIQSRGTGKAEIFIAWLIKDANIQGGKDSYDVNINENFYEVKDWSRQGKSSILTGVKSKVSNFEFWEIVSDTMNILYKLTGRKRKNKFDFRKEFNQDIADKVDSILELRGKIMSGEMCKSDLILFNKFYREMSNQNIDIEGYTNVILRGPNMEPVELSIKPILDITGNTICIEKSLNKEHLYMLTELRRIKYVRNPDDFHNDMQSAVNEIVNGITYIVFRNNRINITKDFIPDVVSISSLKFLERNL
jgi:hypothetical protein